MELSFKSPVSGVIVCLFCSVHRYPTLTADTVHEMEFSSARIDNMVRRVVSPGEMTELFENRTDFLYYRHVVFDRHVQFSEPHVDADLDDRPLQVTMCKD